VFTRGADGRIDDRSPRALLKLVFWGALFGFVSMLWIMAIDNWDYTVESVLQQVR
jgi:hypothetical protein